MAKWPTRKREYKLSEETAKNAVLELLDFYDIRLKDGGEPEDAEKDGAPTVEAILDELLEFYRAGILENKTDEVNGFCVLQHTEKGQTITYRELKGKDRLVHAQYKMAGEYDKKMAALLGRLSGLGEDAIIGLMRDDYRAASTLAFLFFFV